MTHPEYQTIKLELQLEQMCGSRLDQELLEELIDTALPAHLVVDNESVYRVAAWQVVE